MAVLEISLPDDLEKGVIACSLDLKISENEFIAQALEFYWIWEKVEYQASFMKASTDSEVLEIAEEGLQGYLNRLDAE